MERTEKHSYNWSQGVPFSRGIREFLAESRKCQTLYSNCEGAYDRRVFKKEDEDLFKDYIYNTIYCSGGDDLRLSEKGRVHGGEVDSLQRKIFSISNRFGFREEVHVSVVWVYYYAFASEKGLALPVFKIYKTKSREDAVFLNLEFRDHESWDSYLENESFPDAFLCVPRHGQYHFDNEEHKLDLEFVTSRRAPNYFARESAARYLSYSICSYSPFSQNVVRPIIAKIKSFSSSIIVKIKATLAGLQDFWNNHKDSILRGVVFVIGVLKFVFTENWSVDLANFKSLDFFKYVSSYAMMLLNVCNKQDPINNQLCETFPRLFSTNDIPPVTADLKLLGPKAPTVEEKGDLLELFHLLMEPKKNWRRILKIFCSLFRKCRPLLMFALAEFPIALAVVSTLLFLADCLESYLNSLEEPTEEYRSLPSTTQNTEYNCSVTPALSFSQNEVRPSTSFDVIEKPRPPNNSAKEVGDKVKVQSMSVEKLLRGLSDLEELSAHNIEIEEDDITVPANLLHSPVINDLVVQDVDGFRILFMRNPSLPQLTDYLNHLLGTKVSLRCEEPFVFHVFGPSGSLDGCLYYPQPFTVIGLFPLQKIARKEAKKIKILEES